MEDGGIVLSEQKFRTLAEAYRLSPRQREMARHMLNGRVRDAELTKAMGISTWAVHTQLGRMGNKMHCRGRTEILYRFFEDSLSVNGAG